MAKAPFLYRVTERAEAVSTLALRGRSRPDTPWAPIRLLITWLLTRLVLVLLVPLVPLVVGDLNYYATVATGQADADFPGTLREYPVPAQWLLTIPALVGGRDITAYGWWFVLLMLCVDGLFLLALQLLARSPRAVTAWLLAGLAIGPLLLLRFDLVTGAAVAVSLLLVPSRPRAAAVLMVGAVAIKIWPAVLVGIVGAAARCRRAYVAAAAVVSVALVILVELTSGWERLLSPLSNQADRGLQVESLAALPSMLLWALHVDGFVVDYPASLSFEVSGPGTAFAGLLSTAATAGALVWTLWVTTALWRRPHRELEPAVAWAVLSVTSLLVLSNKVFSPQYIVWMLPLVVVLLAMRGDQAARACLWLLMAAAVAAQVLFPWLYDYVIDPAPGAGNLVAVVLVAVRLALVAAVAWIATRRTWQLLRHPAAVADPAAMGG